MNQNLIPQEKRHSGPLIYLGNINLSLPDISGKMVPDSSWINDHFSIILANSHGRKFRRCYEPFSGCASWSLNAMVLDLAEEYVINDSNQALIKTLQLIKTHPDKIKESYRKLIEKYEQATSKKDFFLQTLNEYNLADLDQRAEILPFIVNQSWSGILFYNDKEHLVYHESEIGGEIIPGYFKEVNLSPNQFAKEVDKVSSILNSHKVIFRAGDFQEALSDMQAGDFVALCPPYPENTRFVSEKTGMYYELYSPEKLHRNLVDTLRTMDNKGIEYFLMYGFYNPDLKQYVILDESNQLKHFFRVFGYKDCAWGVALDQLYFSSKYSIPKAFRNKFIPAKEVLNDRILTPEEALDSFNKIAKNAF